MEYTGWYLISSDENGELSPWNICQDIIDIIAKYPQSILRLITKLQQKKTEDVGDEDEGAVNLDNGVIQQAGV